MESPAQTLLNISENHRLPFLSRDVSLQHIFQPLMSGTEVTKKLMRKQLLLFLSEMLDKGEIGLVIAIVCQSWASDVNVKTDRMILEVQNIVDAEEESELEDFMVCFQGLLGNLYHQKAMEHFKEYGSFKDYMEKCMDLYYKIFDNVGRHIWIYGAGYDCLYEITAYKEIIIHFLAKVNAGKTENSGRLNEPGIYTTISFHNHLTAEDFAMFDTVFPATAYILHKVIYAYMALSKEAKSKALAKAYKYEANKVLVYFEKWVNRKCDLYPEIEDDILYYFLGITAEEAGNAKILRASLSKAVKYETTFRGFEVPYGPQFDEDDTETIKNCVRTEQMKTRFHPYRRGKGRSSFTYFLPANLRFRACDITVGPYLHA